MANAAGTFVVANGYELLAGICRVNTTGRVYTTYLGHNIFWMISVFIGLLLMTVTVVNALRSSNTTLNARRIARTYIILGILVTIGTIVATVEINSLPATFVIMVNSTPFSVSGGVGFAPSAVMAVGIVGMVLGFMLLQSARENIKTD